jgi:hypothetical protein
MKCALAFTLLASAAVGFAQQNKDPVSSVVKEILPRQEKNLVAAVVEMPADKFDYKPTPQQMSLAGLVLHNYFCAKAGDVPEPNQAQELKETDGEEKLSEQASALWASGLTTFVIPVAFRADSSARVRVMTRCSTRSAVRALHFLDHSRRCASARAATRGPMSCPTGSPKRSYFLSARLGLSSRRSVHRRNMAEHSV